MNDEYYQAIDKMQSEGVQRSYMLGWIGGYMGNPKLEEQRVTEAYEAGYQDGENHDVGNFANWLDNG